MRLGRQITAGEGVRIARNLPRMLELGSTGHAALIVAAARNGGGGGGKAEDDAKAPVHARKRHETSLPLPREETSELDAPVSV